MHDHLNNKKMIYQKSNFNMITTIATLINNNTVAHAA